MAQPEAAANVQNIQGNHACALAAVAAGCRFYAGYPITPSSEVAERMSLELPKVGGVFIQMEDEIASMGAVLGASLGGLKAMTATSGPGFSLKQEHIGYAIQAEIPCVVVNVMRGGPSTGMPTRPSQGDVMQARWGTHGDHTAIVLAPASVAEIYEQTLRAFNLSERLRSPVILLIDEIIGHLVETIQLPAGDAPQRVERKWADAPKEGYRPYEAGEDLIPAMPRPGGGYRSHTTGLTHDESGFPTQDPAAAARMLARLLDKTERHRDLIEAAQTISCEDAEILVVAYGIAARAARRAVKQARENGIKAGLFRPITLWPFPERAFGQAAATARRIVVAELNAGQLLLEIERIAGRERVSPLLRFDGEHIAPDEILGAITEAA
ncbi:MAG: 2-oxoacid:acceptor oxidoreductase subunit alpha [Alphaproteobacteria bacterium]|jgi:2-oxoglutarate ferredoxin oxidoreductase subunit alpha|nr:2-oxoacid:acceptor oxidoreductase subunit alpha [Alphaproteobacteria bacterium]MDP6818555.1 2-oxoacid:acceptor oxidoreductase subunit alpha [Alphaproteobacteria bacterium]